MNAATPIGTFTKKTHRHDASVTSTPPITGAIDGANATPTDPILRRVDAIEHRHADGCEQTATDALEDPEDNQLVETRRQATRRRGRGEHDDRPKEDALAAQTVAEPP
jgi:hypothetical protein